jgi:hypothetical protein
MLYIVCYARLHSVLLDDRLGGRVGTPGSNGGTGGRPGRRREGDQPSFGLTYNSRPSHDVLFGILPRPTTEETRITFNP